MSFTTIEPAPLRLNRSELAVPGSRTGLFEKAARSAADIVLLDLEDAVAPDQKEQARRNVIAALNDIDWSGRAVSVRVNGLDTPYMYRDVVDVVEQAGAKLDLIMIPKVGSAADVYALDLLVTQIEQAKGYRRRIGFELIIETALGMANIEAIAAASRRVESLHFGSADFAASTGARTTQIGGANPGYAVLTDPDGNGRRERHWGDMWHAALSRLVVAARAYGKRPVDGPFGDFGDEAGFQAAAGRAAALGCDGKWAIHPSQIAPANAAFTPTATEVARARAILAAMEQAQREGKGAVAFEGKMIDIASIRQAQTLVGKADGIARAGR
ncbi:MAG: CoA ester lyase [Proteobacteria bacterium]|nr:CoA ester lyase [Pseudomonadota bacterium]